MRLQAPRLTPLTLTECTPEQRDLLTKGNPSRILNVFATLVRHADMYRRWMPFANHVLFKSTLSPREREIVILRIGHLCRSGYEVAQHTAIGKRVGLKAADLERIKADVGVAGWSDRERLLVRATDELHREQFVSDPTWRALTQHFDERQLIDLVFTVGQYTMVSMALNTFGVQLEDTVAGPDLPLGTP